MSVVSRLASPRQVHFAIVRVQGEQGLFVVRLSEAETSQNDGGGKDGGENSLHVGKLDGQRQRLSWARE
jgi:hypothetical protein